MFGLVYTPWSGGGCMVKSLKATSSPISVSFRVQETIANTFIQQEFDLALNPLDQEVFVVLGIDLSPAPPDAIAATDTATVCSLTTTTQTAVVGLSNNSCLAIGDRNIRAAGFPGSGVAFEHMAGETPTGDIPYIGLIATSNFFVQIQGTANLVVKTVSGRMWGYRATATAAQYAALVQSEVLSA